MNILLIHSYNIFCDKSASANRWRTLVEGLAMQDVNFLYIITSGYKSLDEKKINAETGYINAKIKYQYISFQNRYNYLTKRLNIYLMGRFYNYWNAYRLRKIVKMISPDIIFLHPSFDAMSIFVSAYPKRNPDIPIVMEINEYHEVMDIHTTNIIQKIRTRNFNYLLTRKVFPRLDMCLVMTDALMKYYSKLPGINPGIVFLKVPMTVDLKRFEDTNLNEAFKRPYIAYCGSGGFYTNGVDILINAFTMISNIHPDLRLYLAAFWGQDGEKMVELIRNTGMSEKVFYLGVLSREKIPSFLSGAELLALPRPDSRQAQGGFPTKLGEYLASGKPVCVTRVGEIPDFLEDNKSAFFAEPGDVNSFASAMNRALADKVNAKRVGENGRQVAIANFNMEFQAISIFKFLEQYLAG